MNDERRGLPSCSSLERYALCPGSWRAEQGCPRVMSEDADSGTRVHAYLAGRTDIQLTEDEMVCADACRRLASDLIANTFGTTVQPAVYEQRLWLHDHSLERVLSGMIDVLVIENNRGLVIDYKTGRTEVTEAVGNYQLRGYAVLAQDYHGLDEVTVAIIQPWVSPQVSVCRYTSDDLRAAREELFIILNAINASDAQRIPGEKQCRYCVARSRCPEAIQYACQLPDVRDPIGLAELPADVLSQVLDRCSLAENIIDAVRDEARKRLVAGFELSGWQLKPGLDRETITNLGTVFERFAALGVTQQEFVAACGLSKKAAKQLLKDSTGKKGKALDTTLDDSLQGCVETKTTAPSLMKTK